MAEPPAEPMRLGEVLGILGRRLGMAHPVETGRLWARWGDIVGDTVAEHAEPTSLRDRVLRVRADSPAWATEIGYLREEIRRRANASVGAELVAEIRVWTGPGRTTVRGRSRRADPATARDVPPSARDPAEALARARSAWARRLRGGR